MSNLQDLTNRARGLPAMFSLAGKTALVVGGNKGLGQAISLAFAAAGAQVCVAARGPAGLDETVGAIGELGQKGMCVAVDATDEAAVIDMVKKTVSELGGLDILVNSQGIAHLEPAAEFNMDAWDKVMNVNLRSIVLCCRHAGRFMLGKGWGRIINVSSVRGFQGRIGDLAYAPSKGAVNQLTRSLALEWGPKGLRVNAIAPAFIRTAISAPTLDDPEKSKWVLSRSPLGHTGEVWDMFGPALFLASDACSFVNGHVLMADGGWIVA